MKNYLTLILLTTMSVQAQAQLSLGIKAGADYSKIALERVKSSYMTHVNAGVWFRPGPFLGLYVQPELYVARKGGNFTFERDNKTRIGDGKMTFTTLNIPVLVVKPFPLGGELLRLKIMAGPIFSYCIHRNEQLPSTDEFKEESKKAYKYFGKYDRSSLGLQTGIGFDVGNFFLDVRYENGLTKINQKFSQKQRSWHLGLGFKLLQLYRKR